MHESLNCSCAPCTLCHMCIYCLPARLTPCNNACCLLLLLLLQGMFLLLVTNRGSNILEDLDTLRLLSKLVPEYAGTMLDEEAISRAAFDLIFAFDEVISLGHKENISVMQV